MTFVGISNCVSDACVPVRATYVSLGRNRTWSLCVEGVRTCVGTRGWWIVSRAEDGVGEDPKMFRKKYGESEG